MLAGEIAERRDDHEQVACDNRLPLMIRAPISLLSAREPKPPIARPPELCECWS